MTNPDRKSFTARLRKFDPFKVAILAVGVVVSLGAAYIVGGTVSDWIVGRVNPLLGILLSVVVLAYCVRGGGRIRRELVASMKRDATHGEHVEG